MMKRPASFVALLVLLGTVAPAMAQDAHRYKADDGKIRVAPVKNPYSGARNVAELNPNPAYLEDGLVGMLEEELDVHVKAIPTVALTPEEDKDYGVWHRLGMANHHLGDYVAANEREGHLTIGLLANCSSLMGVLGGLQRSGPTRRPLKIGLVFIDAHGDINTPETTLSGMLGGMPVAVSSGMCLRNLRLESGLDPALPTRYIVMGAVRDTDPLEQDIIDRSEVEHITTEDIRTRSENIHGQMERLSKLVDKIYIHIDMDVLDPKEVAGHPLTVPNGPTSLELADALTEMFRYEKAAGLGVASTPSGNNDPEGLSKKAAYNLIRGAIRGVQQR